MSEIAKQLANRAREKGQVREQNRFFSVTEKREVEDGIGGVVTIEVPNGQHRVKILSEKIGKGKSFNGQEQNQLELTILDNGKNAVWNMPIKNENGTLYYLIEELEDIAIGQEFIVEAVKMKNGHYAKKITHLGAAGSTKAGVPTIQLNDDEPEQEALPSLSPEDDIDPASIPF